MRLANDLLSTPSISSAHDYGLSGKGRGYREGMFDENILLDELQMTFQHQWFVIG
jgi:hypothetical protein